MSDLPLHAPVHCQDGECGVTTNAIVNPVTRELTHIAIRDEGLGDNPTRLVPIDRLGSITDGQVHLECSREDVGKMAPFVTQHLVQQSPSPSPDAGSYFASRYVFNDTAYNVIAEEDVPAGARNVVSGMPVEATDGKIGTLDELVLAEGTGSITHILLRRGHLFGDKHVAVPVTAVGEVLGGTVYLDLDKAAVKALPEMPIREP